MEFKEDVVLALEPDMSKALPFIEQAHDDAGITRGAVITSGTDGKHMKGSLHYKGLAVDLRTSDLNVVQVSALAENLRIRLNGDRKADRPYQIIVESTPVHIHIEYQPK